MRRRDWMVNSAALAAAGAVRGSAANSAVAVGLIGCGGRGTLDSRHLLNAPGARLVALCDLFDERIERARKSLNVPGARAYKNYRELLAGEVDAVIIATPVYLHPEHFEAAVKARKHIYIEKPAAADLEGCRRVIRAADSAGRDLNIAFGFQQRYGPGYRKAKQLVDSGAIGPLRMAHSDWVKGVNIERPPRPKPVSEEDWIRDWQVWRRTSWPAWHKRPPADRGRSACTPGPGPPNSITLRPWTPSPKPASSTPG